MFFPSKNKGHQRSPGSFIFLFIWAFKKESSSNWIVTSISALCFSSSSSLVASLQATCRATSDRWRGNTQPASLDSFKAIWTCRFYHSEIGHPAVSFERKPFGPWIPELVFRRLGGNISQARLWTKKHKPQKELYCIRITNVWKPQKDSVVLVEFFFWMLGVAESLTRGELPN